MNSLKEKIRKEWTFKPVKSTLHDFIGLMFIVGTVFLALNFGWKVGAIFAACMLGISMFVGWKWNF